MAAHKNPLTKEEIGQLIAECQQLVDGGHVLSEARKIIQERWNRTDTTIRYHTKGVKSLKRELPPLVVSPAPRPSVITPDGLTIGQISFADEIRSEEDFPIQEIPHLQKSSFSVPRLEDTDNEGKIAEVLEAERRARKWKTDNDVKKREKMTQ